MARKSSKYKSAIIIIMFCVRITKRKMTSIIVVIKVITSLVQSYDEKGDKLDGVLAALNAYIPLINDNNKLAAIQTILSRLQGKARAAVNINHASVDEIVNKLKEKCCITTVPSTIIAKLNATKQRDSFEKLSESIEKLTFYLERAYLKEDVPLKTASKLTTSAGIKALTGGVKNDKTKLLLKAGQFDTFHQYNRNINNSRGSFHGNRNFNHNGQDQGNSR